LRRHIVTRLSDEGLIIELFDVPDAPLFLGNTAEPQPLLVNLLVEIQDVIRHFGNGVAINGYTSARPIVAVNDDGWDLSAARANAVRRKLEDAGFRPDRIERMSGHADRKPATANPMAIRNNRIELILLRNQI
jgi:chemotaxis protein MotB